LYVGTGPADKMITGRNKIIHLRQNYHFGPAKIQMYLKRYHDVEISSSGVWRILKRLNLNLLWVTGVSTPHLSSCTTT
jgi:transposase